MNLKRPPIAAFAIGIMLMGMAQSGTAFAHQRTHGTPNPAQTQRQPQRSFQNHPHQHRQHHPHHQRPLHTLSPHQRSAPAIGVTPFRARVPLN